jgi:hypothetical protein
MNESYNSYYNNRYRNNADNLKHLRCYVHILALCGIRPLNFKFCFTCARDFSPQPQKAPSHVLMRQREGFLSADG